MMKDLLLPMEQGKMLQENRCNRCNNMLVNVRTKNAAIYGEVLGALLLGIELNISIYDDYKI